MCTFDYMRTTLRQMGTVSTQRTMGESLGMCNCNVLLAECGSEAVKRSSRAHKVETINYGVLTKHCPIGIHAVRLNITPDPHCCSCIQNDAYGPSEPILCYDKYFYTKIHIFCPGAIHLRILGIGYIQKIMKTKINCVTVSRPKKSLKVEKGHTCIHKTRQLQTPSALHACFNKAL